MKRMFGAIMCLVLLAATALPAWAQTSRGGRYYGRNYAPQQQRQSRRYDNRRRSNYDRRYDDRSSYNDRSVWDSSRDKITVAGGAGAGALLGGLAGGKKGAIIGALVGAGGSALYTYKLRDRDRRYRR